MRRDLQIDLIEPPPPLRRADAVARLAALVGADLRPLADRYGVTVWTADPRTGAVRRNKGWAGQVVERFLGQRPNAEQRPDFGDWELKVVPLVFDAAGGLRLKETMAITMFTAEHLETHDFEASHLLDKLRRLVLVARVYEDATESRSLVALAAPADLGDADLYAAVRDDYEEIRWCVRDGGVFALHGGIGRWVQPRPKGGARSAGVGFYARKRLVARLLGLPALAPAEAADAPPEGALDDLEPDSSET